MFISKKSAPLLLLGGFLVVFLACESPPPEDSLTEKLAETIDPAPQPPAFALNAPDSVMTLEINNYVAVVRIDLAPGDHISAHQAGARAVYALTDSSLWMAADGTARMLSYAAGDADTWGPGRFKLENAGENEAELIVVTRFAAALPEDLEAEPAQPASGDSPTPPALDVGDPDFEIMDVVIEPGESLDLLCECPCVIYTVTPATIGVPTSGGYLDEAEVFANRALWFDRGSKPVMRAGNDTTRLVAFEVKR
jgi:hypothetical protein